MTTTVTLTPSTTTIRPTTTVPPSSSSPSSSLTCSPGYQSCPATLGGGCCPTDRACAPNDCPPLSTAGPPVRPTGSTTLSSPRPTSTDLPSVDGCPGGYYMCSAYYLGGCCRVGRDCKETSCPRPQSTTTIDENGATIVVPVGEVTATATAGSCAEGWYSCPADANGGCCPNNYACGTGSQCSATAAGGGAVGKVPPSRGNVVRGDVGLVCLVVGTLGWLLAK